MDTPVVFNVIRLAGEPADSFWDIKCTNGCVQVSQSKSSENQDNVLDGRLVVPGLCHPHIHLDKCFLLSHPKYADLIIQKGHFPEALELTSKAKSRFTHDDLLERGRALIEESINFGVTHMRAFVEVDAGVGMKCLEAGITLKKEFAQRCHVQICAFAQDPLFSYDQRGREEMCRLMTDAAQRSAVDVVGSTPYVEKAVELQRQNIQWMIDLAKTYGKLLDFHLDYNLDAEKEPSIHFLITQLRSKQWPSSKMVTLGHCTRLTMFSETQWKELRNEIGDLPIAFVGLPTSDLYMMGRPDGESGGGSRVRGTLQIPQMIRKYNLQGAIGINNVGNAFTPQGSCDPLSLASMGIGIYQAGTKDDAQLLLECVSTRARAAIGLESGHDTRIRGGDAASFVALGSAATTMDHDFRRRKSVQELVNDPSRQRTTIFTGESVGGME